jgi:hypothetical protein
MHATHTPRRHMGIRSTRPCRAFLPQAFSCVRRKQSTAPVGPHWSLPAATCRKLPADASPGGRPASCTELESYKAPSCTRPLSRSPTCRARRRVCCTLQGVAGMRHVVSCTVLVAMLHVAILSCMAAGRRLLLRLLLMCMLHAACRRAGVCGIMCVARARSSKFRGSERSESQVTWSVPWLSCAMVW